jgi:hypothetical protein
MGLIAPSDVRLALPGAKSLTVALRSNANGVSAHQVFELKAANGKVLLSVIGLPELELVLIRDAKRYELPPAIVSPMLDFVKQHVTHFQQNCQHILAMPEPWQHFVGGLIASALHHCMQLGLLIDTVHVVKEEGDHLVAETYHNWSHAHHEEEVAAQEEWENKPDFIKWLSKPQVVVPEAAAPEWTGWTHDLATAASNWLTDVAARLALSQAVLQSIAAFATLHPPTFCGILVGMCGVVITLIVKAITNRILNGVFPREELMRQKWFLEQSDMMLRKRHVFDRSDKIAQQLRLRFYTRVDHIWILRVFRVHLDTVPETHHVDPLPVEGGKKSLWMGAMNRHERHRLRRAIATAKNFKEIIDALPLPSPHELQNDAYSPHLIRKYLALHLLLRHIAFDESKSHSKKNMFNEAIDEVLSERPEVPGCQHVNWYVWYDFAGIRADAHGYEMSRQCPRRMPSIADLPSSASIACSDADTSQCAAVPLLMLEYLSLQNALLKHFFLREDMAFWVTVENISRRNT